MTLVHVLLIVSVIPFVCWGSYYFFFSPNVQRELRPAPPLRRDLPYRTSAAIEHAVRSQVLLVHSAEQHVVAAMAEIEQAFAERDKYQHALEAISLLGHEHTGPRIARQTLGKEP